MMQREIPCVLMRGGTSKGPYFNRKDLPENLWIKCPESGEMVFHKDLDANMGVVPNSGYHMRISAQERMRQFFDNGEHELMELPKVQG